MAININQLADDINSILLEYSAVVHEAANEAAHEVAKEGVKKLKRVSPKRTGAYGKAWRVKKNAQKGWIIYNKEHYQRTHLLEFGHKKVNGGRVAPVPHIGEVEDWVIQEYERKAREMIEDASR